MFAGYFRIVRGRGMLVYKTEGVMINPPAPGTLVPMRKPKASDISDFAMYAALMETNTSPYRNSKMGGRYLGSSTIWDVQRLFPEFPPKVVRAKLQSMDKRGITDGCYCGCRGDINIISGLPSLYR